MPRRRRKSWTVYPAAMSLILALVFSVMNGWDLSRQSVSVAQSTGPSTPQHTYLAFPVIKYERAQESLPSARPSNFRQCAQDIGAFTPVRLVVDQVAIDATVTPQPLDHVKLLPVPVANFATSGAWWQDGVQPGSGEGVAYIGVHTYSSGYNATGNKLLRVSVGAIAKLYDASGVVGACYLFSRREKVEPTGLPPLEAWRVDGFPGLSVMTCDDFNPDPKVNDFTKRVFYYWSQIWGY